LDINLSIRNIGLNNASDAIINLISDSKIIKQLGIEGIEIGKGRIITVTNILITKFKLENITLEIDTTYRELDKENNNITLEILS